MNDFTTTQAAGLSLKDESTLVDRVKAGDQDACAKLVTLFKMPSSAPSTPLAALKATHASPPGCIASPSIPA